MAQRSRQPIGNAKQLLVSCDDFDEGSELMQLVLQLNIARI